MNKIKNVCIKTAVGTIVFLLVVSGCFIFAKIAATILDGFSNILGVACASIVALSPNILQIIVYVLIASAIIFCVYALYRIGDDLMKWLHR